MTKLGETAINYPGTDVEMFPGDIIYSSKGWSTFLVGHAGIVGVDYKVHHAHPLGGFSESLAAYLSRHKFGAIITVFSPLTGGPEAARWAGENIQKMNKYAFHPILSNQQVNYCTKFVWQAFWYTGTGDISNRKLSDKKTTWIYPGNLKQSWNLSYKTSFVVPRRNY